jgi:NAD(P)-dependent dehydrogenase (short-subunit alcohol dehydrogenase family)
MNYEKLLDGKKAIITAGADGIGYAIARRFEKAGAHVFVCDINEEAVNKANSVDDNIKATVCDLRQTQLISSMVEEGLDHLKEIDIIVNNAGIAGETAAVGDQTLGGWQECLQVNMTSHFETMRLLVPRMNDEGSILSVSSVAGRVGFAYRLPYAATKWAVIGMVKSLAIELGPRGIRANALLPGIVEGERQNRVIEAKAKVKNISFDAMKDEILSGASLNRFVTHDDLSEQAHFLCSPLGKNISGQAISVCGNIEKAG